MHVVLVDNLLLNADRDFARLELDPHLGLLSLAAVIEALPDARATIFDPKYALFTGQLELSRGFYRRMAQAILARHPDVVGFTALGCNFICVARVAEQVRSIAPEIPILLGGPHATVVHRAIAQQLPCFDAIVRNEAEQTLPALLERVAERDFRGIPGVTFRFRGMVLENPGAPLIENLDGLPRPDYTHYPMESLGLESVPVEAGRGCPFRCTFCSTATFFGRRYRLKSAARLVEELDSLHQQFGFSDFKLSHDLFTVNRRKILEFCDAVAGRGYRWRCSARMDCVDPELLERMSGAGCVAMYFGVEAGSERMQHIAKKDLDLRLVEPTLDAAARFGIRTTISLITGYPEELQDDQDATLDLLGRCIQRPEEDIDHQLHMLTPEPGTALLAEYGDRLLYDGFISDFNFQTLEPEDVPMMRALQGVFLTHHYYPTVIRRDQNTFVVSVFKYLRYLGYPVLGFVLHFFEGRMSVLVKRLFDWHLAHPQTPENGALVLEFLSAALGRRHPALSLVRHRYLTERLWKGGALPARRRSYGYVLHPNSTVIRQIHDCARLHELLRADADYDAVARDAEARGSGDFLVVADPRSGELRQFRLESGQSRVFRALRSPRSLASLRQLLRNQAPSRAELDVLVREGVLATTQLNPRHRKQLPPVRHA
jgi:radical SAM superfamily enzyme YgiQ (UPF0313 family)